MATTVARYLTLGELVQAGEDLCVGDELPPKEAAARVVVHAALSDEELTECIRIAVVTRLNSRMAALRQRTRSQDREAMWAAALSQGVQDDVRVALSGAAEVIARVFYMDTDGTERDLLHLSRDGHEMRRQLSAAERSGAGHRERFHAWAVARLDEHRATDATGLPLSVLHEYGQRVVRVWG